MTVISVLHLAEGLMASSAGGMTKLLLNGSHIPSPKVYVNLQRMRRVCMTSKVKRFFVLQMSENGRKTFRNKSKWVEWKPKIEMYSSTEFLSLKTVRYWWDKTETKPVLKVLLDSECLLPYQQWHECETYHHHHGYCSPLILLLPWTIHHRLLLSNFYI